MSDRLRQILVISFMVGQWFTAIVLGGSLDGASTNANTYFIPADITFIVWSFIYLGSTVYAIYQALPHQRERVLHRRVGGFIALNSLLCTVWNSTAIIGTQSGNPPFYVLVTVLLIIGMCYALTRVFIALRELDANLTNTDRWLVQVPASIYFAWLNVAVIANTTSLLVAYGITGEPNGAIWSVVMIMVAIMLTSLMILYTRPSLGTISYSIVIVWAFVGINLGNAEKSALVGTVALFAAALVAAVALVRLIMRTSSSTPQRSATAM